MNNLHIIFFFRSDSLKEESESEKESYSEASISSFQTDEEVDSKLQIEKSSGKEGIIFSHIEINYDKYNC